MSDKNITETEKNEMLLKRLQENDTTALEEIYDIYYGMVSFFAANILAGDAESKDITVQAFTRVWRTRATFNAFDEIKLFLFTATRNLCIDHLRKKKTDKKNLKAYAYHLNNEYCNPEEANSDQEILTFLEFHMGESLRGNKKLTLLMTIQGKKDSEIAAALDITIQTVQNYRYLALKLLRKRFLEAR